MSANEIHVGDVNTEFRGTITDDGTIIDVSGATRKDIILQRPSDGGTIVQDSTFVNTGSDGQLRYYSNVGDLDVPGPWMWQFEVADSNGTWSSDIKRFKVFPNLKD